MRLTAYTNYALRILMFCALHPDQLVRVQDIADAYGISKAHLLKAVRQLGQLGYLENVRGRNGGVRLSRPADEIIIGDVAQKLEHDDVFVECFNTSTNTCPISITRTFPVNGRFSGPQRAIYDLVLEAQFAAIEAVVPNNHWNQPHEAAQRVIVEGLIDLGILHGSYDEQLESGDFKRFFMHRTGHWLGMDVHDVGDYKIDDVWRQLEPGMVTTVEPGIYIAAGSEGVDESWWDIGVRIEDDAVVTAEGCEIITGDVPKQADDVEALMRG